MPTLAGIRRCSRIAQRGPGLLPTVAALLALVFTVLLRGPTASAEATADEGKFDDSCQLVCSHAVLKAAHEPTWVLHVNSILVSTVGSFQ